MRIYKNWVAHIRQHYIVRFFVCLDTDSWGMGLKVKFDRQDIPRRYFFDVDVQVLCFSVVFFCFYEK